ncbi:alginate O- acetylation protein [Helicobacter cinaedi]|uniref:Alginate O- acetylation protein n=2 Tax=Helicobacter cinaedi TaxID=213 RepID=A0A377JLY7_9HELI|nr:alginate O- acetylation protein [Helicobacter cinaedi]
MNLAKGFLVVASLFFYAYWKLIYLPILLGSILVNYFLAKGILRSLYARKQISVDFNGGGDKLNSLSHNFTSFGLFSFCTFSPKTFFTLGIIFNLCLLGIFKYTDFFLENFNLFTKLFHLDFAIPLPHILLPLALSFVTFQQIAFLVDCYKQSKEREKAQRLESNRESQAIISTHINFLDYCLFITFFPQLIAGPIVHHKEMMPQFYAMSRNSKICDKDLESRQLTGDSKIVEKNAENVFCSQLVGGRIFDEKAGLCSGEQGDKTCGLSPQGNTNSLLYRKKPTPNLINWEYIAKGLFIFSIGLFKKVVIADGFAKWANAGFSAVENGDVLNFFESWATSLSYTFQLYFDFSGYCDMAIGLGLLFGIVLPINFNSPYKALNITTFWRKWHITLGRFLKDYLYIPLGGNQNLAYKQSRFYVALNNLLTLRNLFIVAFLSGVWHGAGWGFVIWGSLHGLAMVVHRIYMLLYKRLDSKVKDCACSDKAGRLDFKNVYMRFMKSRIYAVLCWILTFNFVNIAWVFFRAENLQGAVNLLKGMFGGDIVLPSFLESRLGFLSEYGIQFHWWLEQIQGSFITPLWILGAFIVCLGFKNSVEYTNSISYTRKMAVLTGLLLTFCILYFQQDSAFLYFNF